VNDNVVILFVSSKSVLFTVLYRKLIEATHSKFRFPHADALISGVIHDFTTLTIWENKIISSCMNRSQSRMHNEFAELTFAGVFGVFMGLCFACV